MKSTLDAQRAAYEAEKEKVLEDLDCIEPDKESRPILLMMRRGLDLSLAAVAVPLAALLLQDITEHL